MSDMFKLTSKDGTNIQMEHNSNLVIEAFLDALREVNVPGPGAPSLAVYAPMIPFVINFTNSYYAKNRCLVLFGPRTGSHHLVANLHYQDECFSFDERVFCPTVQTKDVFLQENSKSLERFMKSKTVFWKNQWDRPSQVQGTGPVFNEGLLNFCCGALNTSVIFCLRHPYLTYLSRRKLFERIPDQKEHDVTEQDMVDSYVCCFRLIKFCHDRGFKHMIHFHEKLLKERNETISGILDFVGASKKEVLDYEDYFKDSEVLISRGFYNPARKIEPKDEGPVMRSSKSKKMMQSIILKCNELELLSPGLEKFEKFYEELLADNETQ